MIRCDSFSELPGIHLGTCWTVRSAMLMYREGKKKLIQQRLSTGRLPFAQLVSGSSAQSLKPQ
jgi:hypothetical protein